MDAMASQATVLYTKLQIDWTSTTDVMDERDFARFEFKMSFGRISDIAQHPWFGSNILMQPVFQNFLTSSCVLQHLSVHHVYTVTIS